MDDFRDLPPRYRTMPAGELLSADAAHRASVTASVVALAAAGALAYLMWSGGKMDSARRRAALDEARAVLRRRR